MEKPLQCPAEPHHEQRAPRQRPPLGRAPPPQASNGINNKSLADLEHRYRQLKRTRRHETRWLDALTRTATPTGTPAGTPNRTPNGTPNRTPNRTPATTPRASMRAFVVEQRPSTAPCAAAAHPATSTRPTSMSTTPTPRARPVPSAHRRRVERGLQELARRCTCGHNASKALNEGDSCRLPEQPGRKDGGGGGGARGDPDQPWGTHLKDPTSPGSKKRAETSAAGECRAAPPHAQGHAQGHARPGAQVAEEVAPPRSSGSQCDSCPNIPLSFEFECRRRSRKERDAAPDAPDAHAADSDCSYMTAVDGDSNGAANLLSEERMVSALLAVVLRRSVHTLRDTLLLAALWTPEACERFHISSRKLVRACGLLAGDAEFKLSPSERNIMQADSGSVTGAQGAHWADVLSRKMVPSLREDIVTLANRLSTFNAGCARGARTQHHQLG